MSSQENKIDSRISGENARRILQRERNPHLFRPLKLRSVESRNRIMMSPMCQYSATDGLTNDWHFVHLASRAVGGAGIVFTEAVHVEAIGRITPHCLGLWNDEQKDGLTRIARFIADQGALPGIQLGHAGRKASVGRPWEGTEPVPKDKGGWDVIGSGENPYAKGWPIPQAMDIELIEKSINDVEMAVRRAADCGFQVLEIHAAHGYLLHQFYSPLSNLRDDEYGGSFENRIRLLLETVRAARKAWPEDLPLFLRISSTDWVEGGWTLEDSVRLIKILKEENLVDLVDCSSGGNDPRQQIPISPGYQLPFAQEIRKQCDIPTGAVGLLHSPDLAESIVANGYADMIILGRALLADPTWPLRAANTLKAQNVKWPIQYERSNIF